MQRVASFEDVYKEGLPFFFSRFVMFLSIELLNLVCETSTTLLLDVLVGALLYIGLTFAYCYFLRKDYRVYILAMIEKVKKKRIR